MTRSRAKLILVIMILLAACNNQNRPKKDAKIIGQIPMWDFDCDSILKLQNVNADTLTYSKLIKGINDKYLDKVYLEFVKISYDTIFVKIKNSDHLTQQMGTCGADQYMISNTFTLTELKDIKYVHFDFEYGDHASPGAYSRKYYLNLIKTNSRLNQN